MTLFKKIIDITYVFYVVFIPNALFSTCCFCLSLLLYLAGWSCLDQSGSLQLLNELIGPKQRLLFLCHTCFHLVET